METNKELLEQLWERLNDKAATKESYAEAVRLIFELDPVSPAERKAWADSDPSAKWTVEKAALTFRLFARILAV